MQLTRKLHKLQIPIIKQFTKGTAEERNLAITEEFHFYEYASRYFLEGRLADQLSGGITLRCYRGSSQICKGEKETLFLY
jgi:hypothetical protein